MAVLVLFIVVDEAYLGGLKHDKILIIENFGIKSPINLKSIQNRYKFMDFNLQKVLRITAFQRNNFTWDNVLKQETEIEKKKFKRYAFEE